MPEALSGLAVSVREAKLLNWSGQTAGEQLVDLVELMVGDVTRSASQTCLKINTIELGHFNQRIGNCRLSATAVEARRKPILPPESYASHAAFSSIVIDTKLTIVEVGPHALSASN